VDELVFFFARLDGRAGGAPGPSAHVVRTRRPDSIRRISAASRRVFLMSSMIERLLRLNLIENFAPAGILRLPSPWFAQQSPRALDVITSAP